MTPDDLLSKIESLIKAKNTLPFVITFTELTHNISGDSKTLRASFQELVQQGKIRVRQGKNGKLVELCSLKHK